MGPSYDVGHDGDGQDGVGGDYEIPSLAFGTSFPDNNDNKLIGGRIGLVKGPSFELHLSGFHAMYRRGPLELRSEGIVLRQEFQAGNGYDIGTRTGYYVQAARRVGNFEPVMRWGHLLEWKVSGETIQGSQERFAAGINYWVVASMPVKLMYEWDSIARDRVIVQWLSLIHI